MEKCRLFLMQWGHTSLCKYKTQGIYSVAMEHHFSVILKFAAEQMASIVYS